MSPPNSPTRAPARSRDPARAGPSPATSAAAVTPSMRLAGAELIDSREILPDQWLQTYRAPDLTAGVRAGQFVHVRTGDYSGMVLRRPVSYNTVDQARR